MKKVYHVCFVLMIMLVCMSIIPRKQPKKEPKFVPFDLTLDNLRLEVNCLENEASRKTQQAYITTRNLSTTLNITTIEKNN